MKTCTTCHTQKEDSDFYKKGDRLHSMCKQCFNAYCIERWRQRKTQAVKDFGGKCRDCNQEYPDAVFDFHHLDPSEKDFDWNKLRLRSIDSIREELSKCVMLCANCHRIRHIDCSIH